MLSVCPDALCGPDVTDRERGVETLFNVVKLTLRGAQKVRHMARAHSIRMTARHTFSSAEPLNHSASMANVTPRRIYYKHIVVCELTHNKYVNSIE